MRGTLLAQRLVALFVAGWVLLDFPLLQVVAALGSGAGLAGGLFVVWIVLIVVLAWLMERRDVDDADNADDDVGEHDDGKAGPA